jgi:hypothetical protein
MKIKTGNGIYEVMKPIGRIGAKHFAILTSYIPKVDTMEDGNMDSVMQEKMGVAFLKWAEEVLPHIIINTPFGKKYDDIPGQDQFAIFLAIVEDMGKTSDGEFFQVIE